MKYLPINFFIIITIHNHITLSKLISDSYHGTEFNNFISITNFLFDKGYWIKLDISDDFWEIKYKNLDNSIENTICRAIMDSDKEWFIIFMEMDLIKIKNLKAAYVVTMETLIASSY